MTQTTISKALRRVGIRWRKAKRRVYSPDPLYVVKRQRVEQLQQMALAGDLTSHTSARRRSDEPPKAIVSDGDNWQRYQAAYRGQVTAHEVAEVGKMPRCSDPAYGFATYICLHCGETKQEAFSCKSRVCSSCGKVHADEWSRQLTGRLFNPSASLRTGYPPSHNLHRSRQTVAAVGSASSVAQSVICLGQGGDPTSK